MLSKLKSFLFTSRSHIPWKDIANSNETHFDFRGYEVFDPSYGYVDPGREITIDLRGNPCPGSYDLHNVTLRTELPRLTLRSISPEDLAWEEETVDAVYCNGFEDLKNRYLVFTHLVIQRCESSSSLDELDVCEESDDCEESEELEVKKLDVSPYTHRYVETLQEALDFLDNDSSTVIYSYRRDNVLPYSSGD